MRKKALVFLDGMLSVLAIAPAHASVRANYVIPQTFNYKAVSPVTSEEPWLEVAGIMQSTFNREVAKLPKSQQNMIKQAV